MKRTVVGFVVAAFLVPVLASADDPPKCNTWEVEYALTGNVEISDTPMGAADGVHALGPGAAVVRFDDVSGQPGGNAKLMSYDMNANYTINAKVLGIGTSVTTDAHTKTTPNACGVAALGTLTDRTLRWQPWNGMHTDGHLTCSGAMCGRMGAPPRGQSDLHLAPHVVSFKPFDYAADMKSFHMSYSLSSRSTSPSRTSRVELSGRETKRTCIYVPPCP
jgi:hypothetical protein